MSGYEEEPVAIEPTYGELRVELDGPGGRKVYHTELLTEDLLLLLPGLYIRATGDTYGYHSLATDLGLRQVATFRVKPFTLKEEVLIVEELTSYGLVEERGS